MLMMFWRWRRSNWWWWWWLIKMMIFTKWDVAKESMTPPWGKISCTKRASATRRCHWLQFLFNLKTLWRSDKTAIVGTALSTEDSSFHWSWNDLIWWHCGSSSTIWRRKYPFAKYTVAQLDLIRQWPYLIELSYYGSALKENLRKLKLSVEQKVDTDTQKPGLSFHTS